MRIAHLQTSLFESLDPYTRDPYFENWQREIHPILMEVALAPDQIKQLFKGIEQSANDSGNNRSAIGQAKDAAGELTDKVKDAWFNKLGGALQNSQPVKDFDAKWEDIKSKFAAKHPDIAEKLAKYGEFAKNNPKTHKFLLGIAGSLAAALGLMAVGGAAAGITATGLGVGGATAIVNIADRLLKGEKASTAIGRGGTAGLVAGLSAAGVKAASELFNNIAQQFKPGETYADLNINGAQARINADDAKMLADLHAKAMKEMGKGVDIKDMLSGAMPPTPAMDQYFKSATEVLQRAAGAEYQQAILAAAGDAVAKNVAIDVLQAGANQAAAAIAPVAGALAGQKAGAAGEKKESRYVQTRPLSEGQVYLLFKRISQQQTVMEAGFLDKAKELGSKAIGAVGKVAGRVGQNITNKVTYEKLLAGWKLDGSPTDSAELQTFLQSQGVNKDIVDKVYADLKLSTEAEPKATNKEIEPIQKQILALPDDQRQEMIAYLQKQLKVA